MSENLQDILLNEISLMLVPLTVANAAGAEGRLLTEITGWSLKGGADPATNEKLTALIAAVSDLDGLIQHPPESLTDALKALDQISQLFAAARQIPTQPGAVLDGVGQLGSDLIQGLVIDYLKTWHPTIYDVLALLTVIRPPADISLQRISDLLSDPLHVLRAEYLNPAGLATAEDARVLTDKLFPLLASLFQSLGFSAMYGDAPPKGLDLGEIASHISGGLLTVFLQPDFEVENRYGLMLALSPKDHGDFGFVVVPFGEMLPDWDVAVDLTAAAKGFAVGPNGFTMFGPSGTGNVGTNPSLFTMSGLLVGGTTGTRLEVAQFQISGQMDLKPGDYDYGLLFDLGSSTLVLAAGDGDGFLQSVLPADGVRTDFDLAVGWSKKKSFYFRGSAALDATFPVGISIGGIVTIPLVHLVLQARNSSVTATVSVNIGLSIGPVHALIDSVGIASVITFPASGGNLGVADVDFGFKAPSGAGLVIDSAGVSGGGFLAHDDTKHEYSGVLQLQFNNLALQAFGLITTQVAGQSGYSLLALIDADFPPVQLGWGFTLDGVGGLLAVNRCASTDALHAALKANTLSSILFPQNAITNAAQILSTLDAIFPTAAGRFIFGPMALIGWGTPTVFTAAIAVVVELPEPILIILIARLSVRLPSESEALVRINLDALGILDLSQDSLSLDAKLFDSKLLDFTLSGDMALRANWSSTPQREFLLAIGGFHPQFTPPADFPALQRITIDMPSGQVSKLRLAAYLALTSNTVQFGATLDVFIGVSGYGLAGHLGFDALLQIDPFHFDADISGRVALTAGGDNLMAVGLDASLSGPAPWHIAGDFKVHIVFFDMGVSFSQTWGQDAPAPQIAPVQVLPLLTAALADASNWGAALPAGTSSLVSLRDVGSPVVHPLAALEVHESVVPLGLAISRYGSATVAGANSFTIIDYQVGSPQVTGSSVAHETIQDDFAPAQFFELSDAEKLSRPSFERHDAGVRLKVETLTTCGAAVAKTISYETYYVDQPGVLRTDGVPPKPWVLGELAQVLAIGASGRAALRTAGDLRYSAPGTPVKVVPQSFVIADRSSLTLAGLETPQGSTYSAAAAVLQSALAQNPARRAALQIVSSHELVAP